MLDRYLATKRPTRADAERHAGEIGHFAGAGLTADGHSAYNGNHAMDVTVYR